MLNQRWELLPALSHPTIHQSHLRCSTPESTWILFPQTAAHSRALSWDVTSTITFRALHARDLTLGIFINTDHQQTPPELLFTGGGGETMEGRPRRSGGEESGSWGGVFGGWRGGLVESGCLMAKNGGEIGGGGGCLRREGFAPFARGGQSDDSLSSVCSYMSFSVSFAGICRLNGAILVAVQ
ncbi:hypothetical protein Tco_1388074 [Tanacetum coccineum]